MKVNRGGIRLNKANWGFTILETMIFIAVSAFLFISAMAAVSGRQQQVQFSQSVREFDAKINDIINDVSTGYFPTNSSLACAVNGAARPVISSSGSDEELGTSAGCIYVGKALQFAPGDVDDGETKFYIYNLAGRRFDNNTGGTVRNINEALPVAVADPDNPNFNDAVELASLRFGIMVTRVFTRDSANGDVIEDHGVLAILSNFESGQLGSAVSEGQSVQIGGVSSADGLGTSKAAGVELINKIAETRIGNGDGYVDTSRASGAIICLEDQDGRKASVTVGANGGGGTDLQIDNYDSGCDTL